MICKKTGWSFETNRYHFCKLWYSMIVLYHALCHRDVICYVLYWACADLMICLIPFRFMNSANYWDVNWEPLSETTCSGSPYAANSPLMTWIVFSAVVVHFHNFITRQCGFTSREYIYYNTETTGELGNACSNVRRYPSRVHQPPQRYQWLN